jgi:hypothetical protein
MKVRRSGACNRCGQPEASYVRCETAACMTLCGRGCLQLASAPPTNSGDWNGGVRHGQGTLWVHRDGRYYVRYSGDWCEDLPEVRGAPTW